MDGSIDQSSARAFLGWSRRKEVFDRDPRDALAVLKPTFCVMPYGLEEEEDGRESETPRMPGRSRCSPP